MISKKELQYVGGYPNKVPFPGKNYAISVMEYLKKCLEVYKDVYSNKTFSFIFSDGEEINFALLNKNLCHLLGIDFKDLTNDDASETMQDVLGFNKDERKTSFDVLARIIDRADDVIENDSIPSNYKIMNYYKSLTKSEMFLKLSKFDKFNFGCIKLGGGGYESFDSNLFGPQSTKFLFTQSNEAVAPYFMMGLKYDEQCGHFIPETLIAPSDFTKFFREQELVIPTQILIDNLDNLSKINATSEEKLALLNLYKFIINTYKLNSRINIFSDYESVLSSGKQL